MKRIVSLVLALSMVLSLFTTAFAGTSLTDVEGTKYEAAVSALVELGVVNGYEDNTYRAEKVVTRAEIAKLLVIASGLEAAADLNKGATRFNDVAANHWATGYINVATEYGYVNGYPDGSFAPDATVTYAEAVTMAIRVLGYKSVVESKGTWPTNYIAKASELKALKDVDYKTYGDGATRGNVAILVWNILRAPIWDVDSESENDGISYSNKGENTMISKFFSDYEYIDENAEYVVTSISVDDGKVTVNLDSDKTDVKSKENVELGKGTDFLNLYGRKISGLYNTKDEEMVVIAASTDDTVKADFQSELEDADYKLGTKNVKTWGAKATDDAYTVAVIGKSKTADYKTVYNSKNSYVVKETKMSKDTLKITTTEDDTLKIKNEDAIVLIDGEWATREDIKVGDVVTELKEDELYVVNRKSISGSFDDAADDGKFVKVDGEKYEHLLTDKLFEMDSDDKKVDNPTFDSLDKDSKYFDEDCTLYVNFLGEVVRVEFEEIKDEDDGNFYVLTNVPGSWEASDKSGTTRYVELNGEDYEVKTTSEKLTEKDFDYDTLVPGAVVYVTFDNKDRVIDIEVVGTSTDDVITIEKTTADEYEFIEGTEELADNYIGGYKISNSTTVYTITAVEDEEDDPVGYEVEITKGQSALKGIEKTLLAHKSGSEVAAYGFVWEDAKNTDVEYGIIDDKGVQSGKKTQQVKIDGKTYVIDEDEEKTLTKADEDEEKTLTKTDEGKVIAFVENDDGITIKRLYSVEDMNKVLANRIDLDEDDSRMFTYGETKVDLDNDKFEDTTFVVISYDMDDEEFTAVDVYTATNVSVDDDYIYDDSITEIKDVVFIIKGYEFEDETEVKKYTIKFLDDNDEILDTVEVEEGSVPATDKVPTRDEDDTNTYTFDGWATTKNGEKLTELPAATEDATYYPVFTITPKDATGV